ncbi:hypothetical protein ACMFMG_005516 [Clarireedia jacksonii]
MEYYRDLAFLYVCLTSRSGNPLSAQIDFTTVGQRCNLDPESAREHYGLLQSKILDEYLPRHYNNNDNNGSSSSSSSTSGAAVRRNALPALPSPRFTRLMSRAAPSDTRSPRLVNPKIGPQNPAQSITHHNLESQAHPPTSILHVPMQTTLWTPMPHPLQLMMVAVERRSAPMRISLVTQILISRALYARSGDKGKTLQQRLDEAEDPRIIQQRIEENWPEDPRRQHRTTTQIPLRQPDLPFPQHNKDTKHDWERIDRQKTPTDNKNEPTRRTKHTDAQNPIQNNPTDTVGPAYSLDYGRIQWTTEEGTGEDTGVEQRLNNEAIHVRSTGERVYIVSPRVHSIIKTYQEPTALNHHLSDSDAKGLEVKPQLVVAATGGREKEITHAYNLRDWSMQYKERKLGDDLPCMREENFRKTV